MESNAARPRTVRSIVVTILLQVLLLFIACSSILYATVQATAIIMPITTMTVVTQGLTLSLVTLFCGVSFFVLLRGRQLPLMATVVAVVLTAFIAGCFVYHATQTAAPCHYDPGVNLQQDFVSHQVCPTDTLDRQLYGFVFSPLVTTIADLIVLAGIGSLGIRIANRRTT